MKKLFFIRHGYTKALAQDLFKRESPLNGIGRNQAKEAGKDLKKSTLGIDLIISSPLSRAYDTAKYIAAEIGYPVDKIELNDLFVEREWGALEGKKTSEFYKNYSMQEVDRIAGAETLKQLHARAEKAFKHLQSKKQDNILVVSHGSFGRALRRVINNEPHTNEYLPNNVRIGNCELVELI